MDQSGSKRVRKTTKYDISTECPICGKHVFWANGASNHDLVYVKTKRKSVNIYHRDCIDAVQKEIRREHEKTN